VFSLDSPARLLEAGPPGGGQGGRKKKGQDPETEMRHALADRIEDNLTSLLQRVEEILRENRAAILSLAHALETHKTLTGDDVVAVIDGTAGPLVDGRPYSSRDFLQLLEDYHAIAATAHRTHSTVAMSMPVPSLNGSTASGLPQSVTTTLDPGAWPSGNGESPSHEQADWPPSDWPPAD
jgi:cell division protease FtsH